MNYQVPRGLGLSQVKRKKNGNYWCEFGFAKGFETHVEIDSRSLKLLEFCFQPQNAKSLAQKMQLPVKKVETLLKKLAKTPLLKEIHPRPKKFDRYDRHFLFYAQNNMDALATQSTISRSTVTLIGVGGIGNWVALNMIGTGYKEIRLVDFDSVELSNLTRQILFEESSIGKSKISEAVRVLAPRNRQTKIKPIDAAISSQKQVEKIIAGSDFVVLSADRPKEIHDWVDAACVKLKIPYINLGYRDGVGVVGPLTVPFQTSCYQCYKAPQKSLSAMEKNLVLGSEGQQLEAWDQRYQAPSFGPLNALVSTLGSLEVLKYLTAREKCLTIDRELSIHPMTLDTHFADYLPDPECGQCSSRKTSSRPKVAKK